MHGLASAGLPTEPSQDNPRIEVTSDLDVTSGFAWSARRDPAGLMSAAVVPRA